MTGIIDINGYVIAIGRDYPTQLPNELNFKTFRFYKCIDQNNIMNFNSSWIYEEPAWSEEATMKYEADVGSVIYRDIRRKMKELSNADRVALYIKMTPIFVSLQIGDLPVAKQIATELTTDLVYTDVRKTWIVNRIQQEIDIF